MSDSHMRNIPYNCNQICELFSAMLDDELTGEDRARFEAHLLSCDGCKNEYQVWQRISRVLREDEISLKPSPEFTANVMSRLKTDTKPRLWPAVWRTPTAAAVAAVMLFTGSWGVSVALNADKPEAVIVQQGTTREEQQQSTAADAPKESLGETEASRQDQEETEISNNSSGGVEKQQVATTSSASGTTSSVQVFSGVTLLSNSQKDVLTTILKLSLSDINGARDKVMSLAARQGGSGQILVSQKKSNGELVIIKVSVPRDTGVGIAAQLATLGAVNSRTEERNDISADYNKAVSRLNEIQYMLNQGSNDKDRLEAEASGLKRQIDSWNAEASTHSIIVWLEN